MRLRIVMLAAVLLGCGGGGGGDGPTGTENGNGSGNGGGSGAGSGATGSATVAMRTTDDGYGTASSSFAPTSVRITRGGTVTWSHEGGGAVHNVTFSAAAGVPANVENLSSGSASRTFNTAGSFGYRCSNHDGMTGSVTVE